MKSLSCVKPKNELSAAIDHVLSIEPTVVLFFAAPSFFRDGDAVAEAKARLSGIPSIGCSTAGEIGNEGVFSDSVSVMGLRFERTPVKTASVPLSSSGASFEAGFRLGKELQAPDLRMVFLLGPGVGVNGSALVDGVVDCLGRNVTVSGGLAADDMAFSQTSTFCNGGIWTDRVVAVGFYGNALVIGCGSEGGWKPFGPARRVTKAENNVLYEIDGKPALQLYRQYLGDKARLLPGSGLSYPFAILRGDRTTSGIIRSALGIDRENESLIMAGDVPQGSQVCLMHADTEALIQGAAQAAAEALRTHGPGEENGCAIAVSCVGRKIVFGIDAEAEVEAVTDSFLPGTPVAGFYSYGEISSFIGTGRAVLHNQTMTITYVTERVL